ncbi:MAG TPA: tyrosine-type recombinase/integrase, partial [Opitutaceae bacterium]|nr:tyrosine-type recombinase/integrase [Opitutaceae bacterium]
GYNRRAAGDILHKKISLRAEDRTLDKNESPNVRFHALCAEYMEKYSKVRKSSWYTDELKIRQFKKYFGNQPIEAITRAQVNDFALARKRDVQGGTVNKDIAVLRRIFWYAVDNNWLEYNPAQRWQEFPENEPKDDYLEWGQYQTLLDALDRLLKAPVGNAWRGRAHLEQFRYMIPLAFETGGRRGEIVSMATQDLDLENTRVRFWYRKGRKHELKSRWVPMPEHLAEIMATLKIDPDQAYLFPDENGKLWQSKIAFYRQWERIVKEATMPDLTFHRLRHSYCSQLSNKGVDESTRMRLMGHASPVTQQRYTHISEERKRQVVKVFDELKLQSNVKMGNGGGSKAVLGENQENQAPRKDKNASKN